MLRMLAVDHRIEFKGTSNNFIAGRAMQVKLNGQRHVQGHGERMPCQRNQLPGSHAHAVLVTLVVEEHAADVEQIAASSDPPENAGGVFVSDQASKLHGDPTFDAITQDSVGHVCGTVARADSLDDGPVVDS